jgi:hypothetical protein
MAIVVLLVANSIYMKQIKTDGRWKALAKAWQLRKIWGGGLD